MKTERRSQFQKVRGLCRQTSSGGVGLLDHRGVLLGRQVHLTNGRVDLAEVTGLMGREFGNPRKLAATSGQLLASAVAFPNARSGNPFMIGTSERNQLVALFDLLHGKWLQKSIMRNRYLPHVRSLHRAKTALIYAATGNRRVSVIPVDGRGALNDECRPELTFPGPDHNDRLLGRMLLT